MATVTKTIHPLPFEHLEPKRFEDLIRQLAYEWRQWRTLEATGSSGSDDGYDIRGWETIALPSQHNDDEGEEVEAVVEKPGEDRIWLIQCKREQEIGPKKLGDYVDAIPTEEKEKLHGLIIAASCNVSKKARDLFLDRCRQAGISECYIWSRAEIEDMLFQPKNDGILFAYFGISLTIRRRSMVSQLRMRLSTKRKLIKALGDGNYIQTSVLFVDPREERYPYRQDTKFTDLPWKVRLVEKYHALGLIVVSAKYIAYLDDDGIHWDAATDFVDDTEIHFNPWVRDEDVQAHVRQRTELFEIQNQWPQKNRASLTVTGLLKFQDILEVDKEGDTEFNGPMIYVEMRENKIPFSGKLAILRSHAVIDLDESKASPHREIVPKDENRIAQFPENYRKLK